MSDYFYADFPSLQADGHWKPRKKYVQGMVLKHMMYWIYSRNSSTNHLSLSWNIHKAERRAIACWKPYASMRARNCWRREAAKLFAGSTWLILLNSRNKPSLNYIAPIN